MKNIIYKYDISISLYVSFIYDTGQSCTLEGFFMKFLKLPNSSFRNDEIMDRLSKLLWKYLNFKLLMC